MQIGDLTPPLPGRKSVRLKSFDYSTAGAYFLTVCTRDRKPMLGDIRNGETVANDVGALIVRCWEEIPAHFPDAVCDQFALMPNHLHGILFLFSGDDDPVVQARHALPLHMAEAFGKPVAASIPTIIRSFKAAATREARNLTGQPQLRLWHRGYHEHVIRDGADLDAIRRYIVENPAKWESDEENPWRDLLRARREDT